jgi:hypothetical protein
MLLRKLELVIASEQLPATMQLLCPWPCIALGELQTHPTQDHCNRGSIASSLTTRIHGSNSSSQAAIRITHALTRQKLGRKR